jgi:hypothetical protein
VRQEYYYFYHMLHAELLVMYLKQRLQIHPEHAFCMAMMTVADDGTMPPLPFSTMGMDKNGNNNIPKGTEGHGRKQVARQQVNESSERMRTITKPRRWK